MLAIPSLRDMCVSHVSDNYFDYIDQIRFLPDDLRYKLNKVQFEKDLEKHYDENYHEDICVENCHEESTFNPEENIPSSYEIFSQSKINVGSGDISYNRTGKHSHYEEQIRYLIGCSRSDPIKCEIFKSYHIDYYNFRMCQIIEKKWAIRAIDIKSDSKIVKKSHKLINLNPYILNTLNISKMPVIKYYPNDFLHPNNPYI